LERLGFILALLALTRNPADMARFATLEPIEIPGRASPWQLSIPARLSPTGKAQRLFFRTKSEATNHVMTLPEQRSYAGLMENISPAELNEAVRSLELLRPRKISLLVAVTTFLGDLDRRSASKTLASVSTRTRSCVLVPRSMRRSCDTREKRSLRCSPVQSSISPRRISKSAWPDWHRVPGIHASADCVACLDGQSVKGG
jgi:hypothetical protein